MSRFARCTSTADVRLVDVDRLWACRNFQRSFGAACVLLEAEKSLRGRRAARVHRFLPNASGACRHINGKSKSCSKQARESTGEQRAARFERREVLMLKTLKFANVLLLMFGEREIRCLKTNFRPVRVENAASKSIEL